jgi:hypothetical protein
MKNPEDGVLERNIARFIQESVLPLKEDRMKTSFQDFLSKVEALQPPEKPRASFRSIPRRAGLAALAASLISLTAVAWFILAPTAPRDAGGKAPGTAVSAQEKPAEATPAAVSARVLGEDMFGVLKKYREAHASEKPEGRAFSLKIETLDLQQSWTPGNESYTVALRGRISSLELLSELKKDLRGIDLLKNLEYSGSIGPLQGDSFPFTLRASERLIQKRPPTPKLPWGDEPLRFLSQRASQAGLPSEALSYAKMPLSQGVDQDSFTITLTTAAPGAPTPPGEPPLSKTQIPLAKLFEFMRRIETDAPGLLIRNLQLVLVDEIVRHATVTVAAPAPAATISGQPYLSEGYASRLLASRESRQVWGMDPGEIEWAAKNVDQILERDLKTAPEAGGGLRIEKVAAGSICAARGLLAGDIVREVNGKPIQAIADVRAQIADPAMNQQTGLRLSIERDGKTVVLEYRPLTK